VRELERGLWHWTSPHPGWESSEPWDQNVSSYAIDDGERLIFFDPLGVPSEIEALAADREPLIVLTAPWHERDAESLVERLAAPVYTPLPDTAEELMRAFGLTAEQAGDGSPDVVWLRAGRGEAHWYSASDELPSESGCFPVTSGTISCSGSKAGVPCSRVTRSPTSEKVFRSTTVG